jgi:ABC-type Fe3+ transport system substrate-binding protein
MLTKSNFTPAEWNVIRRARFMVGLVVVASTSGPVGVVKEMFAVGTMPADVKGDGAASELVNAVVADLETAEARQQSAPVGLQGNTPEQLRRRAALTACRQAAAVVEQKGQSAEAQAFTHWLVSVGQKVAEAAREGGVLGFEGARAGEQETAPLKELTSALGVKG